MSVGLDSGERDMGTGTRRNPMRPSYYSVMDVAATRSSCPNLSRLGPYSSTRKGILNSQLQPGREDPAPTTASIWIWRNLWHAPAKEKFRYNERGGRPLHINSP
ncbi:hypothetical protein POX_e06840 [Penicillium oxalicum]|uniref:hypothetical protein n=1 Tax=Penicillium oxalicum TaxID=69781 RepID=UPI0020B84B5A|nr:hypothetical protein POX_e06840 [Penicillium oxalicum]KAI2788819.1 hypothetical protein POX_e06840 [Penicillium oxalicum]